MPDKATTTTGVVGGVISVLSALTLPDIGIMVGIATAFGTFLLAVVKSRRMAEYQRRKDAREQAQHELMLDALRDDRRKHEFAQHPNRRYCDRIDDCDKLRDEDEE